MSFGFGEFIRIQKFHHCIKNSFLCTNSLDICLGGFFFFGRIFCLEFTEVGQKDGTDEPVVDKLGSVQPPGHEAPDQEDALKKPVKWNQEQDEVGEELDEAQ